MSEILICGDVVGGKHEDADCDDDDNDDDDDDDDGGDDGGSVTYDTDERRSARGEEE